MTIKAPTYFSKDAISEVQKRDTDAALILSSAANSFRQLIDPLEAADNKPFFILSAESHVELPIKIHHMLMIDALSQVRKNFTIAFETEHDLAFKDNLERLNKLTAKQKTLLNMRYELEETHTYDCPVSGKMFLQECLRRFESGQLRCLYTDASKRLIDHIKQPNPDDITTRNSIKAVGYINGPRKTTAEFGMAVRDHHMFQTLNSDAMTQELPPLFYQILGGLHASGVAQHLHDAGLPYVVLAPDKDIIKDTPDHIQRNIIQFSEIPKLRAHYNPRQFDIDTLMYSDIYTPEDEQAYLDKTFNALKFAGFDM